MVCIQSRLHSIPLPRVYAQARIESPHCVSLWRAEGGVYPAILVVVGNWFPQKELGRANGLFLCSLPLSAAITNPVSGWIVTNYSLALVIFLGRLGLARADLHLDAPDQ